MYLPLSALYSISEYSYNIDISPKQDIYTSEIYHKVNTNL